MTRPFARSMKEKANQDKFKPDVKDNIKCEVKMEEGDKGEDNQLDQEKSRRISLVRNKMAWEEDEACNLEEYERKKKK